MKPLPPETWKPFPLETVVDVPFSCRDDWGRDVAEAVMVGADHDFDLTLVPIELVQRVRYDGVIYTLMVTDPAPTYWREG
jgi:hypothetical protein